MAAKVVPAIVCYLAAMVILPVQGGESYRRSDDTDPMVAVVEGLSQNLVAVSARLDALNTRLQAQDAEISALKASHTSAIVFSAYISDEPRVHAAKGSAIPFRGVIVNTAGGYSTATSAFTAPVSGQYFFIVHVDCSTDFRALDVTHNDLKVFSAHNDHQDSHVTGSAVMTLQKGDVVTTRYYNDAGFVDAGRESTFSGFLVK